MKPFSGGWNLTERKKLAVMFKGPSPPVLFLTAQLCRESEGPPCRWQMEAPSCLPREFDGQPRTVNTGQSLLQGSWCSRGASSPLPGWRSAFTQDSTGRPLWPKGRACSISEGVQGTRHPVRLSTLRSLFLFFHVIIFHMTWYRILY